MRRLIMVSNRLPLNVAKRAGTWRVQRNVGGVVTGLRSVHESRPSKWVGWSGIPLERVGTQKKEVVSRFEDENCHPLFLSKDNIEKFYHGFSNRTIWPLFHYFPLYTIYNKSWWAAYKQVNEAFCETVIKIAEPGDTVWVHDYHLMLLPRMIRERLPDATIGFFLHIPFPSSELFRLLPWREEILEGLLGSDLVGFHTHDYVYHFLNSIRRVLGYEHTLGQIQTGDRVVRGDMFPMGIDYERFAQAVHNPEVEKAIRMIRRKVGHHKIILSIDRLDYTKGILKRLEVFDLFLDKNKKYKGKVTLIQVAVPSRTGVETYMQLKRRLDELVGRINGKHGTIGWVPVWYLYRSMPFHTLVALYNLADVALVTPIRDGMNLISKEFLATKLDRKGVLILSEMAGAANELGEAIIVNPNNKEEVARSLKDALEMSEDEQIERNWTMQMRLQRYDIGLWASDFLTGLTNVKCVQNQLRAKRLTGNMKKKLVADYRKSVNRLILLDHDGTLVPFTTEPEQARPDRRLLRWLSALGDNRQNELVIVSGRARDVLDRWFGGLGIGLIAEHGVWLARKPGKWEMLETITNDWKDKVRPILELHVDRTPNTFIEEKDYSLAWHYRKADIELAKIRARELKDAVLQHAANLNLGVLEGSKVIEVKNAGINKGQAARRWLSKRKWDFVLAIGDDWTDENTFAVLPESAYSIKVGWAPTRARFNVDSVVDARQLLQELVGG